MENKEDTFNNKIQELKKELDKCKNTFPRQDIEEHPQFKTTVNLIKVKAKLKAFEEAEEYVKRELSYKEDQLEASYQRGKQEQQKIFLDAVDDLYRKYKTDVWGKSADEICDFIEEELKNKIGDGR